ncbi:MAG: hypothetical protein WD715_13225 [Dongiaceae bacterium]
MKGRPMVRNPMSRIEREHLEELFEISVPNEPIARFNAGSPVFATSYSLMTTLPPTMAAITIRGMEDEMVRLLVNPVVARRLARELESLGRNAGWWDENGAFIEARPAS